MKHTQNNLTFLRWVAACLVFYGHAFVFMGRPAPTFLGYLPLGALGVYIFFSISGYLIAQSWDNDPNPYRYITRRALRIFPALIANTVLTVFIIGPLFTSLSLSKYFSNSQTWGYFSNIFLYNTYSLPGVFEHNTYPNAINGSLWSLIIEFSMYILLMLIGIIRLPRIWNIIIVISMLILIKFLILTTHEMLVIYRTDVRQLVICGIYFWVGATIYRYNINRFFTISYAYCAIICVLISTYQYDIFIIVFSILLPFIIIAFGLSTQKILTLFTNYDYSYGIYIYAFPIQQSIAYISPKINFALYLIITFILTLLCGHASYKYIEKPALALKPVK